ncbi:TetR/AcrR family transcriptional regulator [Mesoterricola sediminis]|uniref:TetR family transcriptional regulator n=1 Tax=Mesoterricola sediminis TaxID=2927980 RepID=A0AA48H6S0_9BACT|nr:TetR/AcrR family transcriptional regulator [Mesoterricola sediminis]BDU78406.1 TetR family transcriptional regulator [Mesoterricola sediminis]
MTAPRTRDTRERILEAAQRLFLAHGYEGTSMDAIQQAVGGSKATLYAHFAGKDALFAAVLDRAGSGPLALPLEAGLPVRETLEQVADKVLQVAGSPWYARLQRCVLGRAEAAPELAAAFFEQGAGLAHRELAAWLRRQHRAGALRCPRPERSAELFLGLAQGLHAQRALFGLPPLDAAARKAWARQAVQAFLTLS